MAPKSKKTKEEKAAEKAKLEEEARLAEEERLRQEEEARKVAEQIEQRRQQLLLEFQAAQNLRLRTERDDLAPFVQQLQHERDAAAQQQAEATAWQRYLSCTPLPDPCKRPDMNDFLNCLVESRDNRLEDALKECEACLHLARDCMQLAAQEIMTASSAAGLAVLAAGTAAGRMNTADMTAAVAATAAANDAVSDAAAALVARAQSETAAAEARAARYQADAQQLHEHINRKLDAATAQVLHCADAYADDKGDVLLTAQQGPLQWGLWLNMHKNPRFKLIDFGGLGMTVEIPKQLAFANIALRVQRRPFNEFRQRSASIAAASGSEQASSCCLAPLGGVLQVDLLAPSALAKQSRGWTIRQVTPLSSNVSVVPYPIPPAGADLSTWQPDEEPPPLTFSMQLSRQLLVPANLRVGWWDDRQGGWSEEGVSGVSYDTSSGRLTFSSVHLGSLALLQDTAAAVPFNSWTIRPTGGLGGTTATITVQVQSLSNSSTSSSDGSQQAQPSSSVTSSSNTDVVLEVGKGTLTLVGPALPQLSHLLRQPMRPWQLLAACAECGLQLTPGRDEALVAGVQEKAAAVEGAMCADLAMLCTTFLVASSRWNRAAGADAALVRLSEVTDWEEGGRTAPEHAARIFRREVSEGERRVLVARRQGVQGVMFVDGADNRPDPPALHNFSSVDGIQAASKEPYAHLHASLLHLLSGPHAVAEEPRPAAQTLAATAQGLTQIRATDPTFSGTLQGTLQALRLFTFV